MTRLVMLDTETTSLDDERGEVWEIGAIVRDPDKADVEYLWQIRPNLATADPMSLMVGRYYERRILDMEPGEAAELVGPLMTGDGAPPSLMEASDVARALAQVLNGAHVVGAVPDFDYRFLRRFLRRHNECWTAHYHLIDIEALAVGWLAGRSQGGADVAAWLREFHTDKGCAVPEFKAPGPPDGMPSLPWKSTDLYRALGVDPDTHEAHTALGDARLVRDVYDAVTGGA